MDSLLLLSVGMAKKENILISPINHRSHLVCTLSIEKWIQGQWLRKVKGILQVYNILLKKSLLILQIMMIQILQTVILVLFEW